MSTWETILAEAGAAREADQYGGQVWGFPELGHGRLLIGTPTREGARSLDCFYIGNHTHRNDREGESLEDFARLYVESCGRYRAALAAGQTE